MSVLNALGSKTYHQYLSEIKRPLEERYQTLNGDQLVAVYAYTMNTKYNSFREFNFQLRAGVIGTSQFTMVKAINGAIAEISKDKQADFYYRYTFLSEADVERLYPYGSIAAHNFFVSVSEVKKNFISDKCNVVFTIIPDSRVTPAYIAGISFYPHEEEYLYPPNSYFEVLAVDSLSDGNFEILILERPL